MGNQYPICVRSTHGLTRTPPLSSAPLGHGGAHRLRAGRSCRATPLDGSVPAAPRRPAGARRAERRGQDDAAAAIVGETRSRVGSCVREGHASALHDQRPPRGRAQPPRVRALGCRDLVAIEEELGRLEQAMAGGVTTPRDTAPLQRRAGTARARGRLGVARQPPRSSAGWASSMPTSTARSTRSPGRADRASLARAVRRPRPAPARRAHEPPDVENLEWLERELTSLDAAVVLVAHDRWFLEAVTTAVLEPGGPKAFFFDGPWHEWRREKAARASAAATQLDRVTTTSSGSSDSSPGSGTRSRRRSRRRPSSPRSAARAGAPYRGAGARGDDEGRRTLGFEFLKPPRSGRVVLEAEDLVGSAGDKLLADGALFAVEHVALVGPNGSGKT